MQILTYQRQVTPFATILFSGRTYPAPGFSVGQVVVVSAEQGSNALRLIRGCELKSGTSALSDHPRNANRTDRKARTDTHSDNVTSETRLPSPGFHLRPAFFPAQSQVRTPSRKAGSAHKALAQAELGIVVQPLPDSHI
jgi:hypothetical protein